MSGAERMGGAFLIPYLTAGYPTLEDAAGVGEAFLTAGADILEIGIPFSDPLADGPTIQDTTTRAIENGADLRYCFDLASRFADRGAVHQTYRNRLRSLGLVRATYKKSEKGELPSEGTMNPLSTRNLQTPATASNA